MTLQIDPLGNEIAELQEMLGSLDGFSVLEIGCGDGRLTWRYAEGAGAVVGIDPKAEAIAQAQQSCPPHLRQSVTFRTADLETFYQETLPHGERFDRAILAWSL